MRNIVTITFVLLLVCFLNMPYEVVAQNGTKSKNKINTESVEPDSTSFTISKIFADRMVFQQDTEAPIWGKGIPKSIISIKASWGISTSAIVNENGKWQTKIKTPKAAAGKAPKYTIKLTDSNDHIQLKDVLVGEVWLCSGQSNMRYPMQPAKSGKLKGVLNFEDEIANAQYDNIRFFIKTGKGGTVPNDEAKGEWKIITPETVLESYALPYFFARELHLNKNINVPIGVIESAVGGTAIEKWMPMQVLEKEPEFKTRFIDTEGCQPAKFFNGMIYPLAPFAIKGVLWYQGEASKKDYDIYDELLANLITAWRELWQQGDFPFYYVQVAPFNFKKLDIENQYALHREAMERVQYLLSNSGMVTTIDIGNANDIHPRNKQEVARRLALLSLNKTYGIDVVYAGPSLKDFKIKRNRIQLFFKDEGIGSGLKDDEALNHFTIAGADGVFYPAKAIIKGKTVLVSSANVSNPKNVNYAFSNAPHPPPNFKNNEGIAASPFRTENINKKK